MWSEISQHEDKNRGKKEANTNYKLDCNLSLNMTCISMYCVPEGCVDDLEGLTTAPRYREEHTESLGMDVE